MPRNKSLFLMVPHSTVNKVPLLFFPITFKFMHLPTIYGRKRQKKNFLLGLIPVILGTGHSCWLKQNSRLQT